jgi:hypothetical protein
VSIGLFPLRGTLDTPNSLDLVPGLVGPIHPMGGLVADVKAFGAKGDGVTVDDAAIARAKAAGVPLYFPGDSTYLLTSTLDLESGDVLIGGGTANRWRGTSVARIKYTGTGTALRIRSTSGVLDTVTIRNLVIDGNDTTGTVDGLTIDVSGGTAVEGVLVEDCSIINFSRYCVSVTNLVFDVTFRRCSFNNYQRVGLGGGTADNLVNVVSVAGTSQFTFDDCYFVQHNAAKWCCVSSGDSFRFTNGTVAPQLNANGIKHGGSLVLTGTHIEGVSDTGVGVRVRGVNGRMIAPASCQGLSVGIQVGDPDDATAPTFGTTIMGEVGGNTTDIQIEAGGSRRGTMILPTGNVETPVTITNNREGTDGVFDEVVDLTMLNTNGVLDLRGATLRFVSGTLKRSVTVGNRLVVNNELEISGEIEIDGALNHDGTTAGFFGKAPATQRPANADTSGATLAALETEVNELKQLLRDYGLLAT